MTPEEIIARALQRNHLVTANIEDGKMCVKELSAAGYVIVPREPTPAMFEAALAELVPASDAKACYRAMISAVTKE